MPNPTCPKCRALLPSGEPGAVVNCAVCQAPTRLPWPPAPVAVVVPHSEVGDPLAPAAVPLTPWRTAPPPIVYSCPTCQARLQAEAGDAGTKAFCPHCGQKLLVPRPRPAPVNRTVLGALETAPLLPPPLPDFPPVLDRLQEVRAHSSRGESRRQRGEPDGGQGFGIAALVLGIVSLPLALPCFGLFGVICAILAIIFGGIGTNQPGGRGMATTGLVLGVVTVCLWLVFLVFLITVVNAPRTYRW